MDEDTLAMARGNYGYGRWEAPYWFIGQEQGMGDHENKDLQRRVDCWKVKKCQLNDCREFHRCICEMRFHFKQPKVELQKTWEILMLLMMTFLGRPVDKNKDVLRDYQRDRWGALDEKEGETCVIERSGLAAPNNEESKDPGSFLQERLEVICDKMRANQPKLVVMYGRGEKDKNFFNEIGRRIAGREFPPDDRTPGTLPWTNRLFHRPMILVRTPAPNARIRDGTRYVRDEYWTRLGRELHDLAHGSA